MKVFFVTRLFSGLEKSIREQKWSPSGVPGITKILMQLDRACDSLSVIFTKKKSIHTNYNPLTEKTLKIKPLRNKIKILPEKVPTQNCFWFNQAIWSEIVQCLRLFQLVSQKKPDILYVDHANILFAGMAARITGRKVILRLMGIYPFMEKIERGNSIKNIFFRWIYRSPFVAIICTEDGSNVRRWVTKNTSTSAKKYFLMNGIDKNNSKKSGIQPIDKKENRLTITFLGKFEKEKGALLFIRSVCEVAKNSGKKIRAVLIGSGSLESQIQTIIKKKSKNLTFNIYNEIPQKKVKNLLRKTDLYISLNQLGNLSNANLEALSCKICCVFPKKTISGYQDSFTKKLIANRAILSIPKPDSEKELKDKISKFLQTKSIKNNTVKSLSKFLTYSKLITWKQRIKQEYQIICSV